MTKGCPASYSLGDTSRRPRSRNCTSAKVAHRVYPLLVALIFTKWRIPRPPNRGRCHADAHVTTAAVISRGKCTFVNRWPVFRASRLHPPFIDTDESGAKGSIRSWLSRETVNVNRDKGFVEGSSIRSRDRYCILNYFFRWFSSKLSWTLDLWLRLITLEENEKDIMVKNGFLMIIWHYYFECGWNNHCYFATMQIIEEISSLYP